MDRKLVGKLRQILTRTELAAAMALVKALPQGRGVVIMKNLADECGVGRSSFVGTLRKLRAMGLAESQSMGQTGTWVELQSALYAPLLEATGQKLGIPEDQRLTVTSLADAAVAKMAAPEQEYTPFFEEFWTIYPRKIGKKAAYKAWRAQLQKGRTCDVLIRAAEVYAAATQDIEEKYILHPSTFLGPHDRWLDYVGSNPPAVKPRISRAAKSLLNFAAEAPE